MSRSTAKRWFEFERGQPGFRVEGDSVIDDRFKTARPFVTSAGAQLRNKRWRRAGKPALMTTKELKARIREITESELLLDVETGE